MHDPHVPVVLGGQTYQIPLLDLEQLEEVTVAFDLGNQRRMYAILRIALRHAEPEIPDIGKLRAGHDEVVKAVMDVLANAGFKTGEAAGPNPPAPAEPQPA